MNPASKSKINYAAGVQALVNIAVYVLIKFDVIPKAAIADALVVANTLSAALIATFRTWFTKP